MRFISTRHQNVTADFESALFQGLAPDGGLYVPANFPPLPSEVITLLNTASLNTLGEAILANYISDIPEDDLARIIHATLSFPIPLVPLYDNLYLLEVFHGPTLAFKDVGARFMANALAYFAAQREQPIKIIVATSGDTGSAIANAFYEMPGIDIYILYPSGKISELQEKQITTYGGNVHAIEIMGTFDDCQRLVKQALSDVSLKTDSVLTTANSINIARLLPQMIYHAFGMTQLTQLGIKTAPILSVPSGNLGNLTSAIYARLTGFPVQHFIAAINSNTVFADYLQSSQFKPQPSKHTYANAMDVGNPSNFERLDHLYQHTANNMRADVSGISIDDDGILQEIKATYQRNGYILDPHSAVGVAAAKRYSSPGTPIIVTATAHPAKFREVIQCAIGIEIPLPPSLERIMHLRKQSIAMQPDYEALQTLLKT